MASELPEDGGGQGPVECCAKCFFSWQTDYRGRSYKLLLCRRHPPSTLMPQDDDEDRESEYEHADRSWNWVYPRVSFVGWCGEFRRADPDQYNDDPIQSHGISFRVANALVKNGIVTIGQLCQHSEETLLRDCNSIGKSAIKNIHEALSKIRKSLKAEPTSPA